ncbi:O-antigen translocase [Flavobacterium soyangense]|uniref:O-antigen translocase n=1 Tax=Flavobacterium soyangense TaxID=2023265 RepID=A0A930U7W3_9FLAO|nr:O-antigen translocase [Flavobacterium soyangense]MBF2708381.1 O-antigen translocase [Flavobacterium soyangense]
MKRIKKITQTNLFKITSLNSLSIVLRLFIGLITSKVLAIFVGPSGLALLGNFRNFVGSFETVSTLGFQNGIVKYVAESKEKETELKKYVSTIIISISIASLLLSGFLFSFPDFCDELIFGFDFKYSFIFKAFAIALPWYALSLVLVSIINGLGKFKKVIYINLIGNFIGLFVSVFFVSKFQITGALLSIIITPSLLFFVSFYYTNKELSLFNLIRFRFFDFKIIKNLSHYFLMALVSGVIGSVVYIAIRKNIISNIGIQQAGYWEAISKISSYYLLFVSSILTLYFLPKLAVAKNNQETKKIFRGFYKTVLPIFIITLTVIYFSRFFIIKLLFTKEFLPVSTLFFWQLLGDVLKVASLILGYQFFAKKMTIAFIISELFSFGVLYFLSNYLIKIFGIEGIVMAQAFDNFIYFVALSIYFRKSLF